MKANFRILLTSFGVLLCLLCTGQEKASSNIQFKEIPLEDIQRFTAWRTDYYICTGIAYAKSMGQSVEDFAEFVGNLHSLGDPNNATLASVAKTCHLVITSYPGGKYEIISESDSMLVAKWNRPYKVYYKNGSMLGVSLDEFEKYLYGHVAIMASKLNIDSKYEISENEVIHTLTYKKKN